MATPTSDSSATNGNGNGNNNKRRPTVSQSRSLLTIVLDVSPLAWGERNLKRTAQDKSRLSAGKRSVGPAVLEEVLDAVQAFGNAVVTIEREAVLLIVAVADQQRAVVFPRKDVMAEWLAHPESYTLDYRRLKEDLTEGVAELVGRAATEAAARSDASSRQAAMASGFCTALTLINRLLLAARAGGVGALQQEHYLNRVDDEGVVALIGSNASAKKKSGQNIRSAWAPRIMLIQASEDRSRDYNAFMNCSFASIKQNVVVDGCFLAAAGGSKASSGFLEQACDLTGGVYLAPSGAAQVGGALTEVLLAVFLAPLTCRPNLHLPALNKVDFRARCFETGVSVDMALVCNQCLSIFRKKPNQGFCPTCQAKIVLAETSNNKRRRDP